MPLLAVYALMLEGSTPFLAGLAVGAYALMQMCFQYPFGLLSDRFGRKRMIAVGMLIFAAGSVVCALSDHIAVLIVGRFVQGVGVVTSVITASISDLTSETKRSRAMALMGISIAMSFIVALLIAPLIGGSFGVHSLFWISAFLVIPALGLLFFAVPPLTKIHALEPFSGSKLRRTLANKPLVRLNAAMFLHSFVMTASFIMIPLVLTRSFDYAIGELWRVYLPALVCGIFAMAIGTMIAERKNQVRAVMITGICILITAFAGIFFAFEWFAAWVLLLFAGINSLEPLMQSSATKFARADERGAALGLFNACQFGGVFCGGAISGFVFGRFGASGLALLLCVFAVLWLLITLGLQNPIRTQILAIARSAHTQQMIESIEGVRECYTLGDDQVYIRYDPRVITDEKLRVRLLDLRTEDQEKQCI